MNRLSYKLYDILTAFNGLDDLPWLSVDSMGSQKANASLADVVSTTQILNQFAFITR